jgi:hypothetical protein
MLAVLIVRAEKHNTLITVHPGPVVHSARTMQHRLTDAGSGVYWGNLMHRSHDPIFMLLIVMWTAVYSWDEAMEVLYAHVTDLESRVMRVMRTILVDIEQVSKEVHKIRAQLLWYDSLLAKFKESLKFIESVGPRVQVEGDHPVLDEDIKKDFDREVRTLIAAVKDLERQSKTLEERLNHVLKLVVSNLSIRETRASVRHGESMKQM